MSKQYYSVLTHYGTQAFASAIGNKRPLNITQMAVGDGNGRAVQPDSTRTSLIKEVYRANISSISLDPRNSRQVIFELTIPESVGGFYIREMGIFDQQNRLIAYANCPESFKPTLDSGSGKVQVLRMILLVSSSDAITLTVNDSVIFATRGQLTPKTITATSTNGIDDTGHSHQINHATLTQKGIVQLTNDTGLDSETLALTAKAGKALAQQIAENQLNTTNLANQKVDKTAISDSVTSTSQTTVATSKAVKTVYDLAMAKQSPATTLAGYGITDFKVQSASGNVNQFKTDGIYAFTSSSNAQNLPTNNAYHIQVIAGKDSNWCRQIAKKAYSIETYERWQTNYEQEQWSPWVRVDGVDWADIRNAPNASTTRRGLAQYTDNVNFDSSDWGASAKALRTVNLKAEAAQTSANNAQNSANTAQTLANRAQTSANTAQTSANNANNNANNRVAKSGDTMTGTLIVPYVNVTGAYISVNAKDGQFAGLDVIRQGNQGNWRSRIEALPDRRWKFWTENGFEQFVPARNGEIALAQEVVNKAGDTMTGDLILPYLKVIRDNAWINIVSKNHPTSGVDFSVWGEKASQSSIQCQDVGGYSTEFRFFNTTSGDNYETDRRQHVMTIGHSGHIWSKPYGWLDQFFAKQAWANRFKESFYPQHYNGAEVYKIPMNDAGGLMITVMNVTVNGTQEFYLPENYTGWVTPIAVDVGNGRHSVGISMQGGNKVVIYNNGQTGCQVQVIGWSNF